jgi:CHAD domain-containing protein
MAYRFKPDEAAFEGIRRIAIEQIGKAAKTLEQEEDRHRAIHQARKRLKRIRALLRLARGDLGRTAYRRENAWFRDIQRELSAVRDATVLLATLDGLVRHYADPLTERPFDAARQTLVARCRDMEAAHLGDLQIIGAAVEQLRGSCDRVAEWPLRRAGFDTLRPGLKRIYRGGARRFAKAMAEPSAAAFHDWRKDAKYLFHHLHLLGPLWPGPICALAEELDRLADMLGDDHDLAVLEQTVTAEPDAFGGETETAALLGLIGRRRAELQAAVRPMGLRLYAEPAGVFLDRLERWWKVWRSDARNGAGQRLAAE